MALIIIELAKPGFEHGHFENTGDFRTALVILRNRQIGSA
jgi:hypothetical protein